MKYYIFIGIPASGKSTYRQHLISTLGTNVFVVSRDDIREDLARKAGRPNHSTWWYNESGLKGREAQVTKSVENTVKLAKAFKGHVVDDNTNLNKKYLLPKIKKMQKQGFEVKLVVFRDSLNLQECLRRDELRKRSVGAKVLARMHNEFIETYVLIHKKGYDYYVV
jgi:predicted kinase